MKAWLVTWEWMSDAAAVADKVAAIYTPRWGASRVSDHVELLYALRTATAEELSGYAKNNMAYAYRAKKDGPLITCGHHPFLMARRVTHLEVVRDEIGLEAVSWREPSRYRVDADGVRIMIHEGQAHTVKRLILGPLSSELIGDRSADLFKA